MSPAKKLAKELPDVSSAISDDAGGPRSLTRILQLLDVLAESAHGESLAGLSQALASPKSSLLNLLRPLVAELYLIHDGGHYRLGPRAFRMAAKVLASWSFPQSMQHQLEALAERTGETAAIAVLDVDAARVIYVSVVDSGQAVRYTLKVGTSAQLYCTAAGKLLLAHAEEAWRENYLRGTKFKAYTPQTLIRASTLRERLVAIRAAGYAASIEESMAGSGAMAAPLYGYDGKIIAALVVGAPADRLEASHDQLRDALLDAARLAGGQPGPI